MSRSNCSASAGGSLLSVEYHEGLYTVRSRQIPLARILRRTGQVANIAVTIDEETDELVTVEFGGVPLEEALRRLLSQRNAVLTYDAAVGPPVGVRVPGHRPGHAQTSWTPQRPFTPAPDDGGHRPPTRR